MLIKHDYNVQNTKVCNQTFLLNVDQSPSRVFGRIFWKYDKKIDNRVTTMKQEITSDVNIIVF